MKNLRVQIENMKHDYTFDNEKRSNQQVGIERIAL